MTPDDDFEFRDYQREAIVRVFELLGVEPAGPADDPICKEYDERNQHVEVPF